MARPSRFRRSERRSTVFLGVEWLEDRTVPSELSDGIAPALGAVADVVAVAVENSAAPSPASDTPISAEAAAEDASSTTGVDNAASPAELPVAADSTPEISSARPDEIRIALELAPGEEADPGHDLLADAPSLPESPAAETNDPSSEANLLPETMPEETLGETAAAGEAPEEEPPADAVVVIEEGGEPAAGDAILLRRSADDPDLVEVVQSDTVRYVGSHGGLGSLIIEGIGDTLTVDFANGNPIPTGGLTLVAEAGLPADGIQPPDADATLVLQGGLFDTVSYQVSGTGAGTISLDGALIRFGHDISVSDQTTAANRIFHLEPSSSQAVHLREDDSPGNHVVVLDVGSGQPGMSIAFAAPLATLAILGSEESESVTIDSLEWDLVPFLTIDTGLGDDVLEVAGDLAVGQGVRLASGTVEVRGSVQAPSVELIGSRQTNIAAGAAVTAAGGTVVVSSLGQTQVSGTVDASATAAGQTGGNIRIQGNQVTIAGQAQVLASGSSGGTVIVWADDFTAFSGSIAARGGPGGGDGGFVEVSGRETLWFDGTVDVSAVQGQFGTLLLDPTTLTLIDAAKGGSQDAGAADSKVLAPDPNRPGNTLSWGQLDALGATAKILVQALGLITIADVTGAAGGSTTANDLVMLDLTTGSLTIESKTGDVRFADIDDVIRTEGGAVTIIAGFTNATASNFRTTGASGQVPAGKVDLQLRSAKTEAEANDSTGTATALAVNSVMAGTTGTGDADFYRISLTEPGRVTARVHATGLDTRLSLFDEVGRLLVQSDAQSLENPDDLLAQHLTGTGAGTNWFLKVESRDGNAGTYDLSVDFVQAVAPYGEVPLGSGPVVLTTADFNLDGIRDLASVNEGSGDLSILLGVGDGTFRPESRITTTSAGRHIVAADFNGDGVTDLAHGVGGVAIHFGVGDGTFQPESFVAVAGANGALVAGDFSGDGTSDLVLQAETPTGTSFYLVGKGDGTFLAPVSVNQGGYLNAGDFDGDGRLDLAVTSASQRTVSILLNTGLGGFGQASSVAVTHAIGSSDLVDAGAVVVGDFDGDGRLDVITHAVSTTQGAILLGNGDGTLQAERLIDLGGIDVALAAADVNGDGRLDLAAANRASGDTVSVLLGNGDGTFQAAVRLAAGDRPWSVVGTDLNGDGQADLTTSNLGNSASVLLGNGDGTFRAATTFTTVPSPTALVRGDFDNDGRLDLAAAGSEEVSVLLGNGDGTFDVEQRYRIGDPANAIAEVAVALVATDLNRDGRLDLATANQASGAVAVLLGVGDGTFRERQFLPVDLLPVGLVATDANRDGAIDLAATGQTSTGGGALSVLLGDGEGKFAAPALVALQDKTDRPMAITTQDFNGDKFLDLAILSANQADSSLVVSLLPGTGAGALDPETRLTFGNISPGALGSSIVLARPLDAGGSMDLLVGGTSLADGKGRVFLLPGQGNGTFGSPVAVAETGGPPAAILVTDLDGDKQLDLAAVLGTGVARVFFGTGPAAFGSAVDVPVGGDETRAIVDGDFDGDLRQDLATANAGSLDVSVLLNLGNRTFRDATEGPSNQVRSEPLIADFTGDGTVDVITLNRLGTILFRPGRPGSPGSEPAFAPAVPLLGSLPATDVAVLSGPQGNRLAAIDRTGVSMSIYAFANGTVTRTAGPALTGAGAIEVRSAELGNGGGGDLVVVNSITGDLSIFLDDGGAGFLAETRVPVGAGPADVAVVDADGANGADLVVADRTSGDVTVLLNQGGGLFGPSLRWQAGAGPYGVDVRGGGPVLRSQEATATILAGQFNGDTILDLLVVNSGSSTISLLAGLAPGSFANPQVIISSVQLAQVQAADFDGDGTQDLALLEGASLSVWLGGPAGTFRNQGNVPAGNLPTAFFVGEDNNDGKLDLIVGNEFGDVLVLQGNGNGTFDPYHRLGKNIALAVADFDGDGQDDFVFSNRSLDRIIVDFSQAPQDFTQDRDDGILAPAVARTADLNRDGNLDLVVANSGSTDVLVYLGLGGGGFEPARTFYTGTNPVGVTIAQTKDDTGDGIIDDSDTLDLVVANQGSNDVSILVGQGSDGSWTLDLGPRIAAGAGPVAAVVADVNGDGLPDILPTNNQDGTVQQLPGIGDGLFNDQNPAAVTVGNNPVQSFVGNFDGSAGFDLVTLNFGSNDLTFSSGFAGTQATGTSVGTGGTAPIGGVASDFDGDSITDLVVANSDDGQFTLFLGTDTGLVLDQTTTSIDVTNPSDISFAEVDGLTVSVYVTTEGVEQAFLVSFTLEATPADTSSDGGTVTLLTNPLEIETPGDETPTTDDPAQPVPDPTSGDPPPGNDDNQPTTELTPLDPDGSGLAVVPVVTGAGTLPSSIDGSLRAGPTTDGPETGSASETSSEEDAQESNDTLSPTQLAAILNALITGEDGSDGDELDPELDPELQALRDTISVNNLVPRLEEAIALGLEAAQERLLNDNREPGVQQVRAAIDRVILLLMNGGPNSLPPRADLLGEVLLDSFSVVAQLGESFSPGTSGDRAIQALDRFITGLIDVTYRTGLAYVSPSFESIGESIRAWLESTIEPVTPGLPGLEELPSLPPTPAPIEQPAPEPMPAFGAASKLDEDKASPLFFPALVTAWGLLRGVWGVKRKPTAIAACR